MLGKELYIEFTHVLHDPVEAKRRRRLQKCVVLARVAHVTKKGFIQSRRVELDKPGGMAGELKSMWRAGGHVHEITGTERRMLCLSCK